MNHNYKIHQYIRKFYNKNINKFCKKFKKKISNELNKIIDNNKINKKKLHIRKFKNNNYKYIDKFNKKIKIDYTKIILKIIKAIENNLDTKTKNNIFKIKSSTECLQICIELNEKFYKQIKNLFIKKINNIIKDSLNDEINNNNIKKFQQNLRHYCSDFSFYIGMCDIW